MLMRVVVQLVYNKSKWIGKLLFGNNPEKMSRKELLKVAYGKIALTYLFLIVFVLLYFAIKQQAMELDLCASGELLQSCYDNLHLCNSGCRGGVVID